MTVDELLQQLMKIKEVYPDSGKWKMITEEAEPESGEGNRYFMTQLRVDKNNTRIIVK